MYKRQLYDRLTPYVLGMEQAPGLKNMKKRLTGEHKDAVKTRADEAAKLFEKIEDLISCSLDEAELDRKAAEPCLRALFAAVRDFDALSLIHISPSGPVWLAAAPTLLLFWWV